MARGPLRRPLLVTLLVTLGALGAGCGRGAQADAPELRVSAATSLGGALREAAPEFDPAAVRLATGGSDQLAAQIRAGVRPDVFAAADERLPRALHREGLVAAPVAFAGNELVIAVPRDRHAVRGVADLTAPGVRIAAGTPTVPVGGYADRVLARLPAAERRAISANIASREPDVAGVVAKLRAGAVDAGFVYRTDIRAADGRLRGIRLPERLRPQVTYAAAVVTGTSHPALARAYIADLVSGSGALALRRAGFLAAQ